jgi:RNA polymerase sigma factor (sigma-70 family)
LRYSKCKTFYKGGNKKLKDSELIKRIKQGETELLDVLIEGHYDGIYRFCYYKLGDREAAYDCTQETFLHLLRYMDTYVEQKKFKAYLYRIAGNVCTDWFRKNSVSYAGEELLETVAREDGELKRVELSDEILRVLKELSPTQRDVVILHFFYDFKLREIAKMTNVPMSTVKSRMKQGMDKMKKYYGTLNREVGVEKRERI